MSTLLVIYYVLEQNNKSKQTIKTSQTKDDNVTAVNVKLKYIVLEIYLEKI